MLADHTRTEEVIANTVITKKSELYFNVLELVLTAVSVIYPGPRIESGVIRELSATVSQLTPEYARTTSQVQSANTSLIYRNFSSVL